MFIVSICALYFQFNITGFLRRSTSQEQQSQTKNIWKAALRKFKQQVFTPYVNNCMQKYQ